MLIIHVHHSCSSFMLIFLGLRVMCRGGYHPSEAVKAWVRMEDHDKKFKAKEEAQKKLQEAAKRLGKSTNKFSGETLNVVNEVSAKEVREEKAKQNEKTFQDYFSTHPPHRERIRTIEAKIPEVMEEYQLAISKKKEKGIRPRDGSALLFPPSPRVSWGAWIWSFFTSNTDP
eukprot:TRINITY_DN5933_c0_g1_i4.p1 TRINITY_DN5933_c0_g1~~TRINITY_DN5933_c0_g1_i4.p1  ORF type:complete len:172 (+),score=3.11 TRINITY_DN5933_c0_g1_i4:36-551(+)